MAEYQLHNKFVTIDGARKTVSQWCREYDISPQCVHERVKAGWDIVVAITKPRRRYRYNTLFNRQF
jgi:hypothetical protein